MEFFHSLYTSEKICYNARMSIRTFLQSLTYKFRLKLWDLEFPLTCPLRGVSFSDRQGALVQSADGDLLQIVHVPLPNFPYNVYVYNIELNRLLGYLEKPLAKKLVKLFGKNFCRDGKIAYRTGGPPYKYYGCMLEIYETMQHLAGEESLTHLRGE